MKYDLIIIGGGPGGTAGAVYAARKRLKTLFITFEWGGQSVVSEKIYNWIGTPEISGFDLAEAFRKHVMEYKGEFLDVLEMEKVSKVEKSESGFSVQTESGKKFEGMSVLVTTGSSRRKLDVKGAAELEHKGITYCASCDGPIFADQDVIVIGGGNAGFESAAQLLAYCKSVTMLLRSDNLRADKITVEKVLANPKMKIIKNVEFLEITGDKMVRTLVYKDKATSETHEIPTGGIFVEIGQIPNSDPVKEIVSLTPEGKVIVDPMNGHTSKEGIWAAGDITNGLYHQNNIAAGDAVKALEDIYIWLTQKK